MLPADKLLVVAKIASDSEQPGLSVCPDTDALIYAPGDRNLAA